VYAPDFIPAARVAGYREAYDVHQPERTKAVHQRGLRRSPFYAAEQELGSEFLRHGRLGAPAVVRGEPTVCSISFRWRIATAGTRTDGPPIEGAEHLAVRSRVGAFDISAFTKLVVPGPERSRALEHLCANKIDKRDREDDVHVDARRERRHRVRPHDHGASARTVSGS
jgi:hypothetical protein